MKLPNWLHRDPARTPTIEDWAKVDTLGDYGADPYLDKLADQRATPAANAAAIASLQERWAKANETLFLSPPESVEGAHERGYWEGRAEAAQEYSPKYSVEVRRADGDYPPIDEVLLHDATRCLFHLERLDTDHWWLTLSPTGGWDEEVVFDLFRVKKCIEVTEQ